MHNTNMVVTVQFEQSVNVERVSQIAQTFVLTHDSGEDERTNIERVDA